MATRIVYESIGFLLGLVFGSFLNVCISRLPRHESIIRPGSRCPNCHATIRWLDNIPLVSWILLRARCRNCHEVSDKSLSVGPTLQEINKKYPKSEEMLQHVLQPSLKIDESFAAYTVVTADGRTLTGLIDKQNDEEVVLRTAERKTIRLPKSEIEQLKKSSKSLMPDQILGDLTAQEAADLLEYVRSLGAAK